jgi:hypothetical protein
MGGDEFAMAVSGEQAIDRAAAFAWAALELLKAPVLQRAGDMADQGVAHIVAIVIIHILKSVQIDKHHAPAISPARCKNGCRRRPCWQEWAGMNSPWR